MAQEAGAHALQAGGAGRIPSTAGRSPKQMKAFSFGSGKQLMHRANVYGGSPGRVPAPQCPPQQHDGGIPRALTGVDQKPKPKK